MRGYLAATLVILALVSQSQAAATEEHHGHGAAAELNLTLNDGQKWIADKHTFDSVTSMTAMVGKISAEATLQDLRTLGTQLQKQLQTLIRGCTMTGPAHEQLHAWIASLAPAILGLNQSEQVEGGREAVLKISHLLGEFDEHFQLTSKTE